MKKLSVIFFAFFLTINLFGQTCQNEEIKIRYTNGFEVFNVCKTNPTISFDEKKEYYWYTEFSKIKSTKGGCGGNLLNGNYKFYDEDGNLRVDKNYLFGIEDGNDLRWDSLGNITAKTTYKKGETIYWKFLNEEDYWIEFNGRMFTEGTIRKVYTKYGTLISEEKMLADFKQHVKIYYEYPSGQLKEEHTTTGIGGDYMSGKLTSYYKNGKIEVDGQFYEGEYMNIRVGTWKWHNENGTLDSESNYKAEIIHWPNGEKKMSGGYIYDTDNEKWIKIGEWRWYDDTGKFLEKKEYQWGNEVSE